MKKITLLLLMILAFCWEYNAQNTCGTATPITPGTITGTVIANGTGGGQGDTGTTRDSAWFAYTATGDGTIDVSSCFGGADTRLYIFDSCGGTAIANDDDTCQFAPGSSFWASEIIGLSVTNGITYYIEWDDRWSLGPFDWTLDFIPTPGPPQGVTCSSGSSSFIFTENFESDPPAGWTGTGFSGTNGNWDITNANANSGQTGPFNAWDNGSGRHLEYEASGSTTTTASAISPAIDLTSAIDDAELSFFLHAYGAAMGTLNVGVSNSPTGPFTTVFKQVGQLQTTAGAAWIPFGVDLSAYVGQTIFLEFEHTGSGTGFTGDMSIDFVRVEACEAPTCAAPTTQATANATTNIDENGGSATLNWTRGDGDNVVVVMKEGSAVDSDPSIGTSYTANANFGAGDNLGTGNFVVYNGPAATVNITGLNEDTTYHFAVYEYNNTGVCYNTDTTGATGNFVVPCATPINVSALNATPGNTEVTLGWTNSACFDDVLVIAREGSAVTAVPSGDGSLYTANAAFGFGTEITTDEFVVYQGVANTETITSLINGTTYHFTVYTRKGTNWSAGVSISAVPVVNGYCDSQSTNTFDEWISRVRLADIDNPSGSTTYSDFTNFSTELTKQISYPIIINTTWGGIVYSEIYYVFIDFNQDADFDDPGEQVFQTGPTTDAQVTGNFTVPFDANLGFTRMRVVMSGFDISATVPCGNFTFGEVEDYTINITGSVNYTYDDTNNWLPGDPNGEGTAIDTIQIINGEAVINQDTKVDILTINPEAALSVPSPAILQVSGSLNMLSQSDQYSSLTLDGSILGTVNYNRHINDFQSTPGATTGQNDLISPPLTDASQTFGEFKAINTNIPTGTIGGVPSWLFGPFNNSTNAYVNWTAANDGNTLIPGVGYRTASLTPTPSDTFVFTGDVQSGPVTVGISVGSGSEWNLIGNPYPSYLSADDFLNLTSNNSLLDDNAVAIYGYDGTAQNGWDVINFNTPSGYNMAPGQGFLVAAKTGGSITFNEAMRRNTGADDFIPLRNAVNPMVKLQMTSATNSYHTDFYFNDSSTTGLDRGYDAALFDSYLPDFYIYSHLVDDNQGRAMSIQSLGTTDLSDVTVPLGLKVSQGQQVTISIEESTLPTNVLVYLEDNLTNTFTLLNTGDYTFTASTNISGTGRFFLRYNEDTLSSGEQNLNALQIYTTKSPSDLIINGQLFSKSTLTLYDIQGRLVIETTLNEGETSQRIDVSHLNAGIYVANVSNNTQQKTQKVIIR